MSKESLPGELRAAAKDMREQHGPEHERHEMWAAMSSWLECVADRIEAGGTQNYPFPSLPAHVARAYLAAVPSREPIAQGTSADTDQPWWRTRFQNPCGCKVQTLESGVPKIRTLTCEEHTSGGRVVP